MKKRLLGRTGLEVSELVFGGGWVGGLLINADDETRRVAIGRALRAGVNWIDTAPSYGQGRSEEALGWLLPEVASQPYLSTKIGLDCADLGDIAGQARRSIEASLARLGRESVDIIFLHNSLAPETGGRSLSLAHLLGPGGAAEALEGLRDAGLTRFIGLTASGDADCCRAAVASGRFDAAQVYYNMLNPSAGRQAMPARWTGHDFTGLMDVCAEQGTGIVVIRALAAGVLATDKRHGREVVMTGDSEIAIEERRAHAAMAALGLDERGMTRHGTRSQAAIRFVLAHPAISCTEVGFAELDHLDQAIEAMAMGPLPEDALAALEGLYVRNFDLD
jgi:D-threo-aldose 1-dehydrogenase